MIINFNHWEMKGNDGCFYFVPLLGSVVACELKTAFTDQKILPPVQVVCLFQLYIKFKHVKREGAQCQNQSSSKPVTTTCNEFRYTVYSCHEFWIILVKVPNAIDGVPPPHRTMTQFWDAARWKEWRPAQQTALDQSPKHEATSQNHSQQHAFTTAKSTLINWHPFVFGPLGEACLRLSENWVVAASWTNWCF